MSLAETVITQGLVADSNDNDTKLIKVALLATGPMFILILFAIMGISFLSMSTMVGSTHSDINKLAGEPTSYAEKEIGDQLPLFKQAQSKYQVSWAVLAGICKIESGFGHGAYYVVAYGVSEAGAVGVMQFMPTTWSGCRNPKAKDDPKWKPDEFPASPVSNNLPYDTNPATIAQYGGYGIDGDGDGYADPYNPYDAIPAAASYIKANLKEGNYEQALFHYNQSKKYVNQVLNLAEQFEQYQMPSTSGMWPLDQAFPIVAHFGQIYSSSGNEIWPGGHTGIDIACPAGTPLRSVQDGRVSYVGSTPKGGGTVKINDGKNTVVTYCHLSEAKVTEGDLVNQGDIIGLSGYTGHVVPSGPAGAHLHFEVTVNGQLCDPLTWLSPTAENNQENY